MQVRKGVLPRLLEEILSTRIMVKQAMKKLAPSERVRKRVSPGFSLTVILLTKYSSKFFYSSKFGN